MGAFTHKSEAEQFGAALEKARLKQADLARLAGVDRSTVWRWHSGQWPIPHYAWTIVRLQKRVRELTAQTMQ